MDAQARIECNQKRLTTLACVLCILMALNLIASLFTPMQDRARIQLLEKRSKILEDLIDDLRGPR